MDTITVHRHFLLRKVRPNEPGPIYYQIAALESSSPFHLQFFVKRWRSDEPAEYFTTYKEIEDMTSTMHPTLSSALAEVEEEVGQTRRTGDWESVKKQ